MMANKVVRKGGKTMVAQVPADELVGLTETEYLLRSPRNARRLLSALSRIRVAKDPGRNSSSERK
jgi:PHD/YefM family antitoxin component YafN of YafNO toxin-antitoxin module